MATSPIVFDNGQLFANGICAGGVSNCVYTPTPTTGNVTLPSFGFDPAYGTDTAVTQYYTITWPPTGSTTPTNVTPNWTYVNGVNQQYIYNANEWNGQFAYPTQYVYPNNTWAPQTEEDKKRWEEREVRMRAAASRAEELLFLHLSDEQKKQYLDHGYFETKVSDKIYRIKKGSAGNVYLLDKGKEMFRYCAHPSDYNIPAQDAMLAQLLMLHTNEERFLKTANRTVLY